MPRRPPSLTRSPIPFTSLVRIRKAQYAAFKRGLEWRHSITINGIGSVTYDLPAMTVTQLLHNRYSLR
jgi:hypothetical protein